MMYQELQENIGLLQNRMHAHSVDFHVGDLLIEFNLNAQIEAASHIFRQRIIIANFKLEETK